MSGSKTDRPTAQPDQRIETAPDPVTGKRYGGAKTVIAQGTRRDTGWCDDPSIEDENKASETLPIAIPHDVANNTITFGAQANLAVGAPDRDPGATATSGLAVTYTSSDPTKATIVAGKIHAVAAGATNITANSAGNVDYAAAAPVVQAITITP